LILCGQAKRISSVISMAALSSLDQQCVIPVTDIFGGGETSRKSATPLAIARILVARRYSASSAGILTGDRA